MAMNIMRGNINRSTASALALVLASPIAEPAAAQSSQATPASDEADDALNTDIVVTATRRADRLQNIPIAVTAIGEGEIQKLSYDRIEDFSRSVPGLTLNQGERNRANFVIRGISTNSGINQTQDPVAVYIDDMMVSDTYSSAVTPDLKLFDVNRIEVLRGPQGTLFGSGTMGGVVRVITNQPDPTAVEAAGRVGLTATQGDIGFNVDGMVNVPLADGKVAMRAVGYYRDTPGYTFNRSLGLKDSNRETAAGGRLALKWKVTDNFSLTASAFYQRSTPGDLSYAIPTLGRNVRETVVPETRTAKMQFYTLNMLYEAPFADVTSVTSYNIKNGYYVSDFTRLIGIIPYVLRVDDRSKSVSQELRIASKAGSPVDWLVGGYYIDRSRFMDQALFSPGLVGIAPSRGLLGVTSDDFSVRPQHVPSSEAAVFADATWNITDQWTVFGGVRYSHFKQSYERTVNEQNVLTLLTLIARGLITPPVTATSSITSESGRSSGSATTGRFGVRWMPNRDFQVYASASRGFRVGQINVGYGPDPIDPVNGFVVPQGYAPDALWNYEVGFKSSLFDRKVIFNTALFYIDWDNIQISAIRPSDRRVFIANAGEARVKGIEFELRALPVRQLEFGASGSVQSANITDISPSQTRITGAIKGDRLPSSAKFQGSAYVEYHNNFGTGSGNWYLRFTGQHVGASYNGYSLAQISGAPNPTRRKQPAYQVFNLNAGLRWDNAEIAVFANNLFDSKAIVQIDPARSLATGAPSNNTLFLTPRTVGVSLTLRQ